MVGGDPDKGGEIAASRPRSSHRNGQGQLEIGAEGQMEPEGHSARKAGRGAAGLNRGRKRPRNLAGEGALTGTTKGEPTLNTRQD